MAAKALAHLNLPAEVHDHFRKANKLHEYVQKNLGEAVKYALDTGKELSDAKKAIPHGSWESECKRLFDGSLTTARFYMQFYRDLSALPKQRSTGVLLLESTLDGAAKAARKAAHPETPPRATSPPKPAPVTDASEGVDETEPEPEAVKATTATKPAKPDGKPPKQFPRSHWFKQWEHGIGPVCRLVDKIAGEVKEKNDPHHKAIQGFLESATEEMVSWMGVKK